MDSAAAVAEVFKAQQARRWAQAQTSAGERIDRLKRLKAAIVDRRRGLCDAVHADFRKPATEVEVTELHPTLAEIDHAIAHLEGWMDPRHIPTPLLLAGTRSSVHYEAKGLVLVLAPWNYPIFLLLGPLIGAIAAGNCVILKPSHRTRHTSAALAELLAAVFPRDEVAVLQGGGDLGDRLLEQPFDHICFTGSQSVGRKVMTAAARHLASVTLELGGKSPALVDSTADLTAAARRIAWGKFVNAGQTCVAPDYALVPRGHVDAFTNVLSAVIRRSYGNTAAERQASPDLARIIDDKAHARLVDALQRSVAAGARIVIGGDHDQGTRYIAPTVLADVTPDMPIMADEIFGPILPIVAYDAPTDAINFIQARDKPLALYLFCDDPARVSHVLNRTTAGGTVINNCLIHLANPGLPFGGVGASGQGNYHGRWGFEAFSHARAVMHQSSPALAALFAPPYETTLSRLAAKVLRVLE
jgi:aldehyde dehydrogenase (NAD+)